jgi:hypothetical protein
MTNMAERPSGGLGNEAGEDAEGAPEDAAAIEPVLDDASDTPPEQAAADGWNASSPEVKEWAAASDKAFGYDPGGGDDADEAP